MKIRSNGKFNWYGLLRLFKRGNYISIAPTLSCNLKCSYCSAKWEGSSCWITPTEEISVLEWISIINNYEKENGKIKQVNITGGEPFLYHDISFLVQCLVQKKIFVYIFSNLTAPYVYIPRSNYVKIKATYHKNASIHRFTNNLKLYSQYVFVITQELIYTWSHNPETNSSMTIPTIPGSKYKKEKFTEELNYLGVDKFAPNGKMYPKDEKEDKFKYNKLRNEKKGLTANPIRKNNVH